MLIHLPSFEQLLHFLVQFLLLKLLFGQSVSAFSLQIILLSIDVLLNLFQLLGSFSAAKMLLPFVVSSLHQVLKERTQSREIFLHKRIVNESEQFKVFVS